MTVFLNKTFDSHISGGMATSSTHALPVPAPLEMRYMTHRQQRNIQMGLDKLLLATELDGKPEKVQVATLLTVIGVEARDVCATFTRETEGDETKINKVVENSKPRHNIPFERYFFNRRIQGDTIEASRGHARYCECR